MSEKIVIIWNQEDDALSYEFAKRLLRRGYLVRYTSNHDDIYTPVLLYHDNFTIVSNKADFTNRYCTLTRRSHDAEYDGSLLLETKTHMTRITYTDMISYIHLADFLTSLLQIGIPKQDFVFDNIYCVPLHPGDKVELLRDDRCIVGKIMSYRENNDEYKIKSGPDYFIVKRPEFVVLDLLRHIREDNKSLPINYS